MRRRPKKRGLPVVPDPTPPSLPPGWYVIPGYRDGQVRVRDEVAYWSGRRWSSHDPDHPPRSLPLALAIVLDYGPRVGFSAFVAIVVGAVGAVGAEEGGAGPVTTVLAGLSLFAIMLGAMSM